MYSGIASRIRSIPFVHRRLPSAATAQASLRQRLQEKSGPSLHDRQTLFRPRWTPQQARRQWLGWSTAFAVFVGWSLYYGHGAQIRNTPLFKGILFTLRQDKKVREYVGEGLEPSWWVDGSIHHVKGRAKIQFDITGSRGIGKVRLEAIRYGEDWFVKDLQVNVAQEEIVRIQPGLKQQSPLAPLGESLTTSTTMQAVS